MATWKAVGARVLLQRSAAKRFDAGGYQAMSYRVTVAELTDLREITVVCCNCSSKITVAVGVALTPDTCPSCRREFDQSMNHALAAFVRFYAAARASKFRLEVGIRSVESGTNGNE